MMTNERNRTGDAVQHDTSVDTDYPTGTRNFDVK